MNAARSRSALEENRRSQPRTVSTGRSSSSAIRRCPHPTAAASTAAPTTIEQRRHRQRGGSRQLGTRGGVFRQKITDGDRILATIIYRRRICSLNTLAELFGISRSTLWNAINDVQPIMDVRGIDIVPAQQRFTTPQELLDSVTADPTPASSSQSEPPC
ncbi:hypothetical protein ACWDRB_64535 [Nonomuraea sp. NPDC003707]